MMQKYLAIFVGGIVVYIVNRMLGEGKINTVISIIIGIIVAFILYFIL